MYRVQGALTAGGAIGQKERGGAHPALLQGALAPQERDAALRLGAPLVLLIACRQYRPSRLLKLPAPARIRVRATHLLGFLPLLQPGVKTITEYVHLWDCEALCACNPLLAPQRPAVCCGRNRLHIAHHVQLARRVFRYAGPHILLALRV